MTEETVDPQQAEPQTPVEEAIEAGEQALEQAEPEQEAPQTEEVKQVPLSALQKERKKRQELELELEWERRRAQEKPQPAHQEDDSSKYESATKEDLGRVQDDTVRLVEERIWIRANPEKYEMVNEHLKTFLQQRPNLTSAISQANNRYEEAFTLMTALTPKQQVQLKKAAAPKKEAPNSPAAVPKAAAMDAAVDVMSMTDAEFNAWRQAKKRAR